MNANTRDGRNTIESHDVERGDEIIVDGVRDSRQPMTVRVIYHDGAIKAIDQFDGRYEVSAGDVGDRVDIVNDEETLSDYFEIADILAPDDKPSESDRFGDGRIEIEDRGKWNWSLSVTPEGVVRAAKAIRYDGVVSYSTADRPSKPRRRSQHRLDIETVVERYHRHSETEMAEQELRVRVQEGLSEVQ